ncbi:MAG TPA: hypothetical protein VEP69_06580 [Thermodesulfovibrionales bacterium]|nr:hypothetical protein [Thermodesulfovibrionales bacterium]
MMLLWCRACLVSLLMLAMVSHTQAATGAVSEPAGRSGIKMYFFWGNGCPHCEHEKSFLAGLKQEHPELAIESYEVWQNQANAGFLSRMTKNAGIGSTGVPVTFIGTRIFVGFSEQEKTAISSAVDDCLRQPCVDPIAWLDRPLGQEDRKSIDLPLIGEVDPVRVSLPLITIVLGSLDSFNPCAFFVLFFLLSLMVHARSRSRMLIIGGTFIFFSGLIYFLFMAAWLNLFLLTGNLRAITISAGVIALAVALMNIKDFFLFGKGLSLSIPDAAKPKLYQRMRGLLASTSLMSMLAGTAVLAVAANAYELLCTAGFPMVFTRILTLHSLARPTYYLYLVLYNTVYIIPLTAIVIMFTVTLGARKLTEWEGRKLKLLSGIMMLLLGTVLLVRPALLNNVAAAAGMFAAALLLSWAIITFARRRGMSEP